MQILLAWFILDWKSNLSWSPKWSLQRILWQRYLLLLFPSSPFPLTSLLSPFLPFIPFYQLQINFIFVDFKIFVTDGRYNFMHINFPGPQIGFTRFGWANKLHGSISFWNCIPFYPSPSPPLFSLHFTFPIPVSNILITKELFSVTFLCFFLPYPPLLSSPLSSFILFKICDFYLNCL